MNKEYLLHTTEISNLSDILKYWLKFSDSKRPDIAWNYYSDRIYFWTNILYILDISINFIAHWKGDEYITLIIDKNKISENYNLYNDEHFIDWLYIDRNNEKYVKNIIWYIKNDELIEIIQNDKYITTIFNKYTEEDYYDNVFEVLYEDYANDIINEITLSYINDIIEKNIVYI